MVAGSLRRQLRLYDHNPLEGRQQFMQFFCSVQHRKQWVVGFRSGLLGAALES